jgi:hypothetical protein
MSKGPNFTTAEDVLLARAWAKASLDSTVGNNQTSSQFWAKVYAFFKEMHAQDRSVAGGAAFNEQRTMQSMITRWKRHISIDCRKMDAIKKQNRCRREWHGNVVG